MQSVDDGEHALRALEAVIGDERRQHKADPDEEGRDEPVPRRHLSGPQMPDEAAEDIGHDELGDEGDDEGGGRALAVRSLDVSFRLAERRHPRLRQRHVPDSAEDVARDRRDDDGEIADAGECHATPPLDP